MRPDEAGSSQGAGASISVVIPALNEERRIGSSLRRVLAAGVSEVIVVDGGSEDRTAEIAAGLGATVLRTRANRGLQQNLGARRAKGEILLFLHADTVLPRSFPEQVRKTLSSPEVSAGAFQFHLDADGWQYRLVERVVALRCKLFRMPYGDQAIFMPAERFRQAGGFAELQVMEDFDLVRRLRRLGRVELAAGRAITSARRWMRDGVWSVTARHQLCILGYYARVAPGRLARFREAAHDLRSPQSPRL